MKKIIAHISAFMLILVGILSLASCSGSSFYSEWHSAGAAIESENIFKSVTVDEAEAMLKDSSKNTFALFLGSSSDTAAVSNVTSMQYTADVTNYTDKVYFLTITEIKKSQSKMKEVKTKLGNVDVSEMGSGVYCVMYEDGKVKFNTANKTDDILNQFKVDKEVSIIAVLEYVFEVCPVKE